MDRSDSSAESTGENKDFREEFLLSMYNQLWNSVQRVEQGMWSFITSQVAALASIAGGATGLIPIFSASLLAALISFWGMNISMISGRWVSSNLIQVENIELDVFGQDGEEWGTILPEKYKDHPTVVLRFFPLSHSTINFFAFLMILLATIVVAFSNIGPEMTSAEESILLLIISVGIGSTIINYRWSLRFVRDLKSGTSERPSLTTSFFLGNRECWLRTILTIGIPIAIFVGVAQVLSDFSQDIVDIISSISWYLLGFLVIVILFSIEVLRMRSEQRK